MTSMLENAFVQLPNYIFLKNTRSEFIACNANFAKSAGIREPKSIHGKTDYDLPWADSHAELYREGDQEVLQGVPKLNVVETQLRSNGDIISIIINKTPLINESGHTIGIIGSYMEASPRDFLSEMDVTQINCRITKAESDFLYYIAKGLSLAQIANNVDLPILIVKSHIEILKRKLNCSTDLALHKKSLSLNIIKKRLFGFQAESSDSFTNREMDIIHYLLRAKTAKSIAADLELSV
jgi:DNA-binding CsgD family transcriptional regulator